MMRGADILSGSLFSYVDLETRVPEDHPLRAIREIVNGALSDLEAALQYRPSAVLARLSTAGARGNLLARRLADPRSSSANDAAKLTSQMDHPVGAGQLVRPLEAAAAIRENAKTGD